MRKQPDMKPYGANNSKWKSISIHLCSVKCSSTSVFTWEDTGFQRHMLQLSWLRTDRGTGQQRSSGICDRSTPSSTEPCEEPDEILSHLGCNETQRLFASSKTIIATDGFCDMNTYFSELENNFQTRIMPLRSSVFCAKNENQSYVRMDTCIIR